MSGTVVVRNTEVEFKVSTVEIEGCDPYEMLSLTMPSTVNDFGWVQIYQSMLRSRNTAHVALAFSEGTELTQCYNEAGTVRTIRISE